MLIVSEIYAAGEEPIAGVSGEALAEADPGARPPGRDVRGRARAARRGGAGARRYRAIIVITLGAGDITAVGPELLERLRG